jgi:eukaryotic-like serine/threonine-protein kinase
MRAITPGIPLPDRFAVCRHIANGGMAAVWAAEDRLLGREVAVKLLAEQFVGDEVAKERFMREARAAAGLSSHPHVVTIYDVGEHEGRPYIVMEHMSGGSVADAVRRGLVPRDQALGWLRAAGSALDAAHARGVVHRDVKPANLLLDENGRLAVGDFGIARVALDDTLTTTGQVLGTASYMAPEQINGKPATSASDRYSLGVVAYRLLAGRRPFPRENFAAQARAHVEDDPPPPSKVNDALPAALDPVLLRALAKDPSERWPNAAAFVDAVDEALRAGAPTAATAALRTPAPLPRRTPPPRTPPPRTPPPQRPVPAAPERPSRRGLAAAALGAVALALLAVVLLASSGGGGGEKRAARSTASTTSANKPATTPRAFAPGTGSGSGSGTAAPASGAGTGGDPAALNDQGYALSQAGRYSEAIPLLQRAVDGACGPGAGLTCAYALYNLGHALRLAGRPGEAIPVLERRLQFNDQRDVVQRELDLARSEAGTGGAASAAPAPQPAGEPGKGKGKKDGGG